MKVTLKPETLGIEILKAISENRNRKAKEFNRKQAEKYLRSMQKTGDIILIQYAERKLNELT